MLYRPEDSSRSPRSGTRAACGRRSCGSSPTWRRRTGAGRGRRHPTRRWHRGVRSRPSMPARRALSGRSTRSRAADTPNRSSICRPSRLERSKPGASPAVFRARRPASARVLAPRRPSRRRARRLAAHRRASAWPTTCTTVRANVHADEIDELMWGTAGTSLPPPRSGIAPARSARTRCRESAAALLARREVDGFWTQRRFKNCATSGRCTGSSATSRRPDHHRGRASGVAAGGDERRPRTLRRPRARPLQLAAGRRGRSSTVAPGRSGCNGVTARPESSPPRRRTSTRSCCSAAPS